MNTLQHLLDKIDSVVKKNNQLLDATGGRFNVFQIIGVTTDETRLHSAFINELLNVKGSHGLKDKPLKSFIRHCIDDEFDFQTMDAVSKTEHYIGVKKQDEGGRIDIIIWDNNNRAIIIENKIYAGDQEFQMLRYQNHAKKNYADSRLIYLTLDGKSPSENSLGGEKFDYKLISYKYDILNWLTECKQLAVDFPLVREAISHYINLIKHLTNTSIMDEMNKEIVALIMQSPENIKSAFELEKAITDVKIKTQWEFWKQLQKSLEEQKLNVIDTDSKKVLHWKVKGYYEKLRNKDLHYGLWIEIYNQSGITIHWGCEIQDNIYFGFTLEKNGEGGISNNEEFRAFRQIINDCDERYKLDSDFWLGRMDTTPILNFRSFNSQEIFDLVDKGILEKTTDSIAEKAFTDINFIKNRLKAID